MKIKKVYKRIMDIGFLKTIYWLYLKKFNKKKYNLEIIKFLKNDNIDIINCCNNNEINSDKIKYTDNIWFFWWQGENDMPKLVKSCYKNVQYYSGKRKVVFLSKDNFLDYVSLPNYILEKYNNGSISITHFSDIIRMNLLSYRGGIWVDATVYVTDYFFDNINENYNIYTRKSKKNTKYISNGIWTGYFMATGKNNLLATACYKIFCNYWKKYNSLIDYFLIDYVIYLLYQEIEEINCQINSIPFNNEGIHNLQQVLNEKFEFNEYKNICKNTSIHKLSWKKIYQEKDKENNDTYYGRIINSNIRNM